MPNKYQLAFLATFLSVFTALILLSRFLDAQLIAAGYDIRNLILIGLPKPTPPPVQSHPRTAMSIIDAFAATDFHAVELPLLGTVDLVAVTTSTTFIVTSAIIVATAIYVKIFHTGRLSSQLSCPVRVFISSLFRPHQAS
jgi:cytochrome-b5 reductase